MAADEQFLEFPCSLTLKVIGDDEGGFAAAVVDIVRLHAASVDEKGVTSRPSRGGRYLSVAVPVRLDTREQFEALYTALSKDERVAFVL